MSPKYVAAGQIAIRSLKGTNGLVKNIELPGVTSHFDINIVRCQFIKTFLGKVCYTLPLQDTNTLVRNHVQYIVLSKQNPKPQYSCI